MTTSSLPVPAGAEVVDVETAAQMEEAVLARAADADVVVMAAAVADFRPKVAVDSKLHKSDGVPELVLEATNDILAELGRRRRPGQVLVGFAAETDDVPERARAKLEAKGVDLMVANDVSAPRVGFDHDTNAVTIFGADGTVTAVALAAKAEVADAVLDRVVAAAGAPARSGTARAAGSVVRRALGDPGARTRIARRPQDPPHQQHPDRRRRPCDPTTRPQRMERPVSSRYTFTSESVTEGHPDKMADQISDSVLDALLTDDPDSRVACETLLTTGLVLVAGEITTTTYVDIPKLVRQTVLDIGYDDDAYGIDGNTCGVIVSLDEQSPDIGQGVDKAFEVRAGTGGEDQLNAQGAGDQGMMFGYACDETPDLMPLPIWLAHRLAQRLAQVRRVGTLPYLRPDGKTQVSVTYEDGRPIALETVLISTQHDPGIDLETLLLPDLRNNVIDPLLPAELDTSGLRVLANPTGVFELGGPHADTGLTGRKIIVDTYGGMARHGGGAFSGKDPSKVDRSAAYAARWVAKNVVAAGAATRCEVQVAYAIGVARPVSLLVETFGTEQRRPGGDRQGRRRGLRPPPGRHRARSRPEAPDLPQDRGLRALRPVRQGLHLGGHRPGGRPEAGARPLTGEPDPTDAAGGCGAPGGDRARVVRVVPDVPAIHRRFDYAVPPAAGRLGRGGQPGPRAAPRSAGGGLGRRGRRHARPRGAPRSS